MGDATEAEFTEEESGAIMREALERTEARLLLVFRAHLVPTGSQISQVIEEEIECALRRRQEAERARALGDLDVGP